VAAVGRESLAPVDVRSDAELLRIRRPHLVHDAQRVGLGVRLAARGPDAAAVRDPVVMVAQFVGQDVQQLKRARLRLVQRNSTRSAMCSRSMPITWSGPIAGHYMSADARFWIFRPVALGTCDGRARYWVIEASRNHGYAEQNAGLELLRCAGLADVCFERRKDAIAALDAAGLGGVS
jgi:hypothetical protein